MAFNRSRLFYRLAESFVPGMAYVIITMPVWLSFFHPAVASYLILAYLVYFIFKSIKTLYFAGVSFKIMEEAKSIDWHKRMIESPGHENIKHVILIVNYKETFEKMSKTLDKLVKQSFNSKNVVIVFGMEHREGDEARRRARLLTEKYKKYFGDILTSYHVISEGEVPGKASNATYACHIIESYLAKKNIDTKNVIITVSDADSLFPNHYLSYVTYEYIKDENRFYHFYWAPALLYNRFWELWLPVRIQTILSSVLRLSFLSQKDDLIQISTYSMSFWLVKSVGYWDTDIIPEDWHIQLQTFFKHGDKIRTVPIFLPVIQDAIMEEGIIKTFKSRYDQERRWAWGAADIPYAIVRAFETPEIPMWVKLKKIAFIIEIHLFWPSSFFLLTLSASIPSLVNPAFGRTVLGFLLPKFSSFILTISSLLLIAILYIDHKMRKQIRIKTDWKNIPLLLVQWYLLPIISFFLSSLPALDAHTRMLLGKRLDYKVTKKL